MKKKRRIVLCSIMTLVMALVMAMPISASAVVDANDTVRIGNEGYATLADAVASIQEGETAEITLLKSVTNNSKININSGKNITIDLNGNDIGFSRNQQFNVEGGTLTLSGTGTVYEQEPYYAPIMMFGAASDMADYSVVNIGKNVTLKGWAGLFIDQNNKSDYGIVANVYGNLNSVKDITGAGGHALYVNGSIKATEGNVPKITLDGAILNTEDGNGMYLAGYTDTVINNSTITSNSEGSTGIEIRAGKLEIVNSIISGGMGEPTLIPNGNGSTTGNTALSVAQHTTKLPIEVTIIGGSFNGGDAFSQQNPQGNDEAAIAKISLDIQSGTFNGRVYSENKAAFISSGTFSEAVNANYIKDGLVEIQFGSKASTLYYIGTEEQINAIVEDAVSGDHIKVLQGDVALSIMAGGVEVSNNGGGQVTVNQMEVAADNPIITEEQITPEQPTSPTQPSTTTPADETTAASNDKAVATGDDFNMTALLAIMGVAAAAAAGTVVYGRRKRSN